MSSQPRKYVVEAAAPTHALCRACGERRALNDFRIYLTKPQLMQMDFCVGCEKREGTVALYRRFSAYATAEITTAVFAANRVPVARRTPDQTRLVVAPRPLKEPESNEELIQREIARRELARRRLVYFIKSFKDDYMAGWVHHDICRRLERFVADVEAGKSPRLMIFVPPRHGKSEIASVNLPAWILGKHPEWPIIASSYAQSLPIGFSRQIRDRLGDPDYAAIFPDTTIRSDARGVEEWKTTKGGGYVAAGVGTGITGKGFMVGIVDDPIKDDEEAQSEVIRDGTFNWYQSTFRSRAAPGAGILFINTRWHFDDPSGRLINIDAELKKAGIPEYERENWDVISYPALAEADEYMLKDGVIVQGTYQDEADDVLRLLRRKGDALHPERYPVGELKKIKNGFATGMWNALYQQAPSPEDGDFFRKQDFRYRWLDPVYRPLCRRFLCVDYAIGKKQRNDFTVAAVFALDSNDDLYVLEVRRGRWGTMEIASNILQLVEKHDPEVYAGEQGQLHSAVWPVIQKELDQNRKYLTVDETLVPIQDKETRARPLQGRIQRRKLYFSHDEAERPDIYDITEREMLQFPNGVHDDIVDCMAWGARLALNTSLPNAQAPRARQQGWEEKLLATKTDRNYMAA